MTIDDLLKKTLIVHPQELLRESLFFSCIFGGLHFYRSESALYAFEEHEFSPFLKYYHSYDIKEGF